LLGELRLLLIDLALLVFASILCGMKISGRAVNELSEPIILVFLRLNVLLQLEDFVFSVLNFLLVLDNLLVEFSALIVTAFNLDLHLFKISVVVLDCSLLLIDPHLVLFLACSVKLLLSSGSGFQVSDQGFDVLVLSIPNCIYFDFVLKICDDPILDLFKVRSPCLWLFKNSSGLGDLRFFLLLSNLGGDVALSKGLTASKREVALFSSQVS
jgi:hypothetical protein